MVFEDDYCLQNDAQQPLTPNTCVNAEAFYAGMQTPTFAADCNMIIRPQALSSLFCR
jgi:hypothetical protein